MANFQETLEFLQQQFFQIDLVQWTVLLLGVSEVLLARANHIGLYPTGIAATTLAIYGLFNAGLYGECLLHLYYIVMSMYGWWYWIQKRVSHPVVVTLASRKEWMVTLTIAFIGWGIVYGVLIAITSSTVPAWDAWVTSTAWAGMWLLAKRKVENWLLLNISNAFAIPLLFQKQLPLFALLTTFLFLVACKGYFDWLKIARSGQLEVAKS